MPHQGIHVTSKLLSIVCGMQEIRRVWCGYMAQCDADLGRKLAAKLQSMSAL